MPRRKPIEIQSEEEVELLMAQASRRGPTGLRPHSGRFKLRDTKEQGLSSTHGVGRGV